jgi:FSR family fosmidomycin resistance protein-like MFS transporter
MLLLYALAHFLVDFACAYLLFSRNYDAGTLYIGFLLYNFCAFALQMPLGLLADRLNKNALTAVLGCGLVAMAFGFTGAHVLTAVTAGIGNGLFHIGGGIDVFNAAEEKAGPLGVFVSPGALGIFLGRLLGKQAGISSAAVTALVVVCLLAFSILIILLQLRKGTPARSGWFLTSGNAPVSLQGAGSPAALAAALCLLVVVCLRSYVGMTLDFTWKGEGYWGYILLLAVVLGKTAGGFLCDRFGPARTSAVTLGLAAVCFLSPKVPLLGVAAVFLFNMTMPVTLWAMARLFPGAKGFAFGLLTFGLFLGFVPVYLGYPPLLSPGPGFTLAAAASLIVLVLGLRLVTGTRRRDGGTCCTGIDEIRPGEIQTGTDKSS